MGEEQITATELSIESFKDSHFLEGKNVGCTLDFRGKVVLVNMLINDGESKWDDASVKEYTSMLQDLSTEMMSESGLNKEQLQVAHAHCVVNLPYPVGKHNISACITDTLRQFGDYKTVQKYQAHYQEKFGRDEAVLVFVFNKEFRSYAQKISLEGLRREGGEEIGEEYSIVSFSKDDVYQSKRTLKHEILHQFGAIDYYYPVYLKNVAKKRFPDSVMNDGNTVDDFTRYLIGWDEEPTQEALRFLSEINTIPKAEIEYANRMELMED